MNGIWLIRRTVGIWSMSGQEFLLIVEKVFSTGNEPGGYVSIHLANVARVKYPVAGLMPCCLLRGI